MITPFVGDFVTVWSTIYNVVVVASNDNESSRVTVRLFDLWTRAVMRLTMSEVAEVEDGVVIIDCVAIVYEEFEGDEHYRNKN